MIGIQKSKYYNWKERLGKSNNHNCSPKTNQLLDFETQAIITYAKNNYSTNDFYLKDGYRRLTYNMLDKNIAAVSPSSVYRILHQHGLLNQWNTAKTSQKGTGFVQPDGIHKHWHTDIKYINFHGSFLFLISVMDGYSRYILHHEVRKHMTEKDLQITIQRAKEKYPSARPRIITDNGAQFTSKDFSEFIKHVEMMHIKTSVAYPQSNGKLERFHRSIGCKCLNTKSFINISDTRIIIAEYIKYYNNTRLHSSLFYLTPEDVLLGKTKQRIKEREDKLNQAALIRKSFWIKNKAA